LTNHIVYPFFLGDDHNEFENYDFDSDHFDEDGDEWNNEGDEDDWGDDEW
jgi:hypothetical protein